MKHLIHTALLSCVLVSATAAEGAGSAPRPNAVNDHEGEFTYPQPWWVKGRGFIHMNTKCTAGREIYFEASSDGRSWDKPVILYFTNKAGTQVWRLPYDMEGETARPELVNP